MPKVYVDAGHGGNDTGAVANGLREKDIALSIARRVEADLRRHGVDVRMSRTDDTSLTLQQRTDDANRWGADALVSIHLNAAAAQQANGFEVWHSVRPDSPGRKLAALIAEELDTRTTLANRGTKSKVNVAGRDYYHIIRESRAPAVIVEVGFITNPTDAAYLREWDNQATIAEAIVRGILRFFGVGYKAQPVQKPKPSQPSKTASNTRYRLFTGTFSSKEAAEEAAEWLRKTKGWTVYVKEERSQ